MRRAIILAVLSMGSLSGGALSAQTPRPMAQAFSIFSDDADRPRLGISTRSSGRRDTLGLLVSDVSTDSPAEKAGLEEGDRLISVNGVNLRLSRDDAEDEAMSGVATRRLTRELGKHKAGDEVELRVYRDGQTRTLRAKLVAPEDLDVELKSTQTIRTALRDRAVLGVSLGGSGSRRDTLGVLVVGVTDSGPAALAGIEEGDRLAAINGVDLRVDREDAGDWESSNARIRRLNRAMEKVKAGDDVELRVYSQGQTRTVRAKAAKSGDLRGRSGGFFFNDGNSVFGDGYRMLRTPSIQVLPRRAPSAGVIVRPRMYYEPGVSVEIEPRLQAETEARVREALERASEQTRVTRERVNEAMRRSEEALRRSMETRLRALRSRNDVEDSDAPRTAVLTPAPSTVRVAPTARIATTVLPRTELARALPATAVMSGRVVPAPAFTRGRLATARAGSLISPAVGYSFSDDGMIALAGLRLIAVERDLASYFGEGSERGLLVVQANSRWPGIRSGDVILTIDGRAVRRADGSTSVVFRDEGRSLVELLRGGRRIEVRVER